MASTKAIEVLIAPAIESMGFELYGSELQVGKQRSTLVVYVDSPHGVSIDDCAKVSRQVAAVLDVEDPISTRYDLQVSSPGIERPLFNAAHYQHGIGHRVKLRLRLPRNNQRNFIGWIKAVGGERVTIEQDDGQLTELAINDIAKAKLIVEV